jgi:hypothetical protein
MIKSPICKQLSMDVDVIEVIQQPLTPSSTDESTTKSKY